ATVRSEVIVNGGSSKVYAAHLEVYWIDKPRTFFQNAADDGWAFYFFNRGRAGQFLFMPDVDLRRIAPPFGSIDLAVTVPYLLLLTVGVTALCGLAAVRRKRDRPAPGFEVQSGEK